MNSISLFFFPDNATKLLVALCYFIIVIIAFKRFSNLAVVYGTFDAPEKTRPWTTFFRFYSAGAIYACVHAVAFALLFKLLRQYPVFVEVAENIFASDPVAEAVLPKIKNVPEYSYPILAILALTIGVNKFKPVLTLEQNVRSLFQRLGSIPKQISRTIHLMQRSSIKINNDCFQSLGEEINRELEPHLQQRDEKTFERLYLRARHLHQQLLSWNNKLSPYYHFRTIYPAQFDNVCAVFARLDHDIQRYFNTLFEFRKTFQTLQSKLADNQSSIDGEAMFTPLRKQRAELRGSLKEVLENMYTFIAAAILSEGVNEGARIRRLKSIGFYIPRKHIERISFADPNDMALLSLLLFLVVPVMALFCSSLNNDSLSILAIWPAIAIWIGFAGVIPVAIIKKNLETSPNDFWTWLRKTSSKNNLLAYIIAAVVAFAAGAVGMYLLVHLNPRYWAEGVEVPRLLQWALIPSAIAIATGLNYDRVSIQAKTSPGVTRLTDIGITALFATVATVFAYLLSSHKFDLQVLRNQYVYEFLLPGAALFGGIIGAIVPTRYRRQKAQQLELRLETVDLMSILGSCRNALTQRLSNSRVVLEIPEIPPTQLKVDRHRIQQAIIGLLTNALEYCHPDDTITIQSRTNEANQTVTIEIKDTGTGISQGQMLEIRESFENLDTPWLYLINDEIPADLTQIHFIITHHGGIINIERNEVGGTAVTLTLPMAKTTQPESTTSATPETAPDG